MRISAYAGLTIALFGLTGIALAETPVGEHGAATAPPPNVVILNAEKPAPAPVAPADTAPPAEAATPLTPPVPAEARPVAPAPGAATVDTPIAVPPPASATVIFPAAAPDAAAATKGAASPASPTAPPAPASAPAAAAASKKAEPPVAVKAPAAVPAAAEPPAEPEAHSTAAPPPPEPTLTIDINLSTQRMTVAEYGAGKYTWPVSSARYGYRTPTGTFQPSWMSKMWYSRQFDWAPMPHAIFFHRGVAIHGSQAIRSLGRPASHGCVRLATGNAATLYKLVGKHGKGLTRIVVHGTPMQSAPEMAEDGVGSRYASWRRAPGYEVYGYDTPRYDAPRYYGRRPPRDMYYYPPPPRRYVQRGYFRNYGVGYGF